MGKCVITEADILEAVGKGLSSFTLPSGDCIITPQARDRATLLGIAITQASGRSEPNPACPAGSADQAAAACQAGGTAPDETAAVAAQVTEILRKRLPSGYVPESLERLVRQAVQAKLAGSPAPQGPAQGGQSDGVCRVDGERLLAQAAGPVPVNETLIVAQAIGKGDGAKLSGGIMAWEKAGFERTVEAPEIVTVVEGELSLTVGGQTLTGKPGDMFYLPGKTKVAYSAPGKVRLSCVSCIC